jgi:hypothetical protein
MCTLDDLKREQLRLQCERLARIGRVLIDAALANRWVQEYLAEPIPLPMRGRPEPFRWTVDMVRRNPPCRHEWQHTRAIAGVGEGLSCSKGKTSWGEFIGILPLEPDDPVGFCRILYVYKPSNPWHQRVEQRHTLKRKLGKRHRKLVGQAMGSTKGEFIKRYATDDAATVIKRRLQLEPGEFWRVVKGKVMMRWPEPPAQGLLFEDFDE